MSGPCYGLWLLFLAFPIRKDQSGLALPPPRRLLSSSVWSLPWIVIVVFGISNQKKIKVVFPGLPSRRLLGSSVWSLPWIVVVVFVISNQKRPKWPFFATSQDAPESSVWSLPWSVNVVFGISNQKTPKWSC